MSDPKSRSLSNERAVSPVIGVILMVAITVILAAVIGTFVLDLGSDVQANPQAGITFDDSVGNSDEVEITINSKQQADTIEYDVTGTGPGFTELDTSSVGDSVTVTVPAGERIIVRASYNGNQAVIREYDG